MNLIRILNCGHHDDTDIVSDSRGRYTLIANIFDIVDDIFMITDVIKKSDLILRQMRYRIDQ